MVSSRILFLMVGCDEYTETDSGGWLRIEVIFFGFDLSGEVIQWRGAPTERCFSGEVSWDVTQWWGVALEWWRRVEVG